MRALYLLEARGPERQAAAWHFEQHFIREAVTHDRRRELFPWKEGQVRTGMPYRIGVEEMIRARIVLVDGLLHQPHAENAGIEIDVLLCVAGDGGDVVDPVNSAHPLSLSIGLGARGAGRGARGAGRGARGAGRGAGRGARGRGAGPGRGARGAGPEGRHFAMFTRVNRF